MAAVPAVAITIRSMSACLILLARAKVADLKKRWPGFLRAGPTVLVNI